MYSKNVTKKNFFTKDEYQTWYTYYTYLHNKYTSFKEQNIQLTNIPYILQDGFMDEEVDEEQNLLIH